MKPFDVPTALDSLRDAYLSAADLLAAAGTGSRDARYALARLWLSEGIPFAFRARPAVYESLRLWLARRLGLQAKEITLVGSARQGFSLTPGPNLGRPFGEHSDLDLTVVSLSLFTGLAAVFERWRSDYGAGVVVPRGSCERRYWDANVESVPRGLERGFIDPHKIPTWNRYPEAQKVAQSVFEAAEKLKATGNAPHVNHVSVRVYSDWDSFVRQLAMNLEVAARPPAPGKDSRALRRAGLIASDASGPDRSQ